MSIKTLALFIAVSCSVQITFGQSTKNDLRPPYLENSHLQSSNLKFDDFLYVPKENINLIEANQKSKIYLDSILANYCDFQYKSINSLGYNSFKGKKTADNLIQNFNFYKTTVEIINPKGLMIRLAVVLDSNFQLIETSELLKKGNIDTLCKIISWEKVIAIITKNDVKFLKEARHTSLVYNEKTNQFLYKIITTQKTRKILLKKGYKLITTQMWIDALTGEVVFYGKKKEYRKYLAIR